MNINGFAEQHKHGRFTLQGSEHTTFRFVAFTAISSEPAHPHVTSSGEEEAGPIRIDPW